MTNRITDFTNYTTPQSTDVLPIVDLANDITKKITYSTMLGVQPYSYLISVNGGTYSARNGTSNVIDFSGTNFDTVMGSCITTLSPTGGSAGWSTDRGGRIHLAAGTYQGNVGLNVRNNITISGEGVSSLYKWGFNTGTTGPDMNSGGFRQNSQKGVRFTNFKIDATELPLNSSTHQAISFYNCQQFEVDHMYVDASNFALFITSAVNASNPDALPCKLGWIHDNILISTSLNDTVGGGRNTVSDAYVEDITIENNYICKIATGGANDFNAIDIVSGRRLKIINNTCFGNITLGNETDPHVQNKIEGNLIYLPFATDITTDSHYNMTPGIIVEDSLNDNLSGNLSIRNNTVYGPIFINNSAHTAKKIIKSSISGNMIINDPNITGTVVYPLTQSGISLTNCQYFKVSDNYCDGRGSRFTGIKLVDSTDCSVELNHIVGYSGTASGGGVGIDESGTSATNYYALNTIQNCVTAKGTAISNGFYNNIGVNPIQNYNFGNTGVAGTLDRSNGDDQNGTVSANTTLTLPTPMIKGDYLSVGLSQPGTAHTVTWVNAKLAGGTAILSGANATDKFNFKGDGTNWIEIGRALNVS